MKGLLTYNSELDQYLEFSIEDGEFGEICHIEWVDNPSTAYIDEESFFALMGHHIGGAMAQAISDSAEDDVHKSRGELRGMLHEIYFVPCDREIDGVGEIYLDQAYSINEII